MVKLKYYWVAKYDDNTDHPQFNPDGTENLWGDVDQDKVIEVSWRQFSWKLSNNIEMPTNWALLPKKHAIKYNMTDNIFICRRNHIDFSSRGEEGRRIEYILGKDNKEIIKL